MAQGAPATEAGFNHQKYLNENWVKSNHVAVLHFLSTGPFTESNNQNWLLFAVLSWSWRQLVMSM